MEDLFYKNQSSNEKELYIRLLRITGSLSNLFAETENPFLYYRAMENIFCKAFGASNYSRSDISADAGKDKIGIGLKTFLQNNGYTFQKVAEFNKQSYLLKNLENEKLVYQVSLMRNERIESTKRICDLDDMIYHIVTRSKGHMDIFEEHMDSIDIDKIQITKVKPTMIHFSDGINEYSFNISKSTLLKRFDTKLSKKLSGFDVDILEDPYEFLLNSYNNKIQKEQVEKSNDIIDYIVLPLYSPKTNQVEAKSGLNQWNAAGRKRDKNEVYISIPAWIHKVKSNFFDYTSEDHKTDPFDVILPNGRSLSMRVAQEGGKALMSNPNKDLGKWLLRDVLNLKEGELVTKNQLDKIGIDSLKLSKRRDGNYYLDFLESGSFEIYQNKFGKLST